MPKKIVLLTLQTFSTTGGIQKMTRTLAHSLTEIAARNKWSLRLWSVHDKNKDVMTQYIPAKDFKGFGVKRISFTIQSPKLATTSDVVILSHINLAFIGLIIKLINPKCKIWLIAHGIEVWRDISFIKMRLLKRCDKVICVSNFTKQEIIRLHHTNEDKCYVLNNAIDPLMKLPDNFIKPQYLLDRYKLNKDDLILFTLTRLAVTEQYKGYEQVIKVIDKLKLTFPTIKYVLSGQYDDAEEVRIKDLIHKHHVEDQVILTGFITETEVSDHFLLADLFILPSKKEGFGIVFIEALACGLPVVCGNVDGSVDAIRNGELGKTVNPDDLEELECTLTEYLKYPLDIDKRKHLQQQCLHYFNEDNYINKLQDLLLDERTR
ncbi:glycosyltransferase family 4 protein [Mucilaginibacter sp. UYCu711]|uniref:glycosyltransferase family 4 protein n=1 Tax=Mucilaginibacter sp. UYCu711 TaxID=3156339 RepID=UPI003D24AB10